MDKNECATAGCQRPAMWLSVSEGNRLGNAAPRRCVQCCDAIAAALPEWRPDGSGVQSGADVGGDDQVSEVWSVRWSRSDMPGKLITDNWYAEEVGTGRMCRIVRQTEYMDCNDSRDPGNSENWSDATYRDWCPDLRLDVDAAEVLARRLAEVYQRVPDHLWNGEWFHGGHSEELLSRLIRDVDADVASWVRWPSA